MPSPRKGSPVTGDVAAGTTVGDSTAKAGSVSKLTDALPAMADEDGSVTNADPFHTTTALIGMILGEEKVTVIGLRNVPGYGAPLRLTPTPAPSTTWKPGIGVIAARSGAVMVICTSEGKAPAGTWTVTRAPSTVTGPTIPPAGPTVTVVTTAVNPPGGVGVVTGGGTDCLPAVEAEATPAVPSATTAPSMTMTNSLIPTTLRSRRWTYRFHCAGMNPPFSSRTDGQLPSGASAVRPKWATSSQRQACIPAAQRNWL
jgi:hypothetical protein